LQVLHGAVRLATTHETLAGAPETSSSSRTHDTV